MAVNAGGKTPLVSVIIPTYKHRDFVCRALESVWAQTFTDYEIIVINDGSPDDTHEVLAPFVASGRIQHYIHQENTGQSIARNRGIAIARGEFIALLDDDDQWPADKLQWQLDAMEENPGAPVVYGQPVPVDSNGEKIETPLDPYGNVLPWPWTSPGGHIHKEMSERSWLVSPGQALLRRSKLPDPPFDTRLWGCDDWDLWLCLAEQGEYIYKDKVALYYRLHHGNASRDTLRMRRNEFRLLRKHLIRSIPHPERWRYMAYRYKFYLKWTPPWLLEQVRRDINEGRIVQAEEKMRYVLQFRPWLPLRGYYRSLQRIVRESATKTAGQR